MNWTSVLCPEERQALVEPASFGDISSSSARSALSQLISHQAVPTSCYYSLTLPRALMASPFLMCTLSHHTWRAPKGKWDTITPGPPCQRRVSLSCSITPSFPLPSQGPAAQQAQCQLLLPWLRTIARSVL